ncbi:MAG: hypothetical protein KJ063_14365 [Anaerolineae bacterium]|nr:hypothetical protein [Anaerolineae bacterium]
MNEQHPSFLNKLLTTIFYAVVASLVFYTRYGYIQWLTGLGDIEDIDFGHQVLLLVSGVVMIAAALLNLWHPRMAAWLALTGGLIACGRYVLTLCGLTLTGFPQIFTPAGYVQALLPAVLLYMVIVYANWARKTTDRMMNPLFWFWSKQARPHSRITVIAALIFSTAIVGINLASSRTVVHAMSWSIDDRHSDSRCHKGVTLSYVEAPGYRIYVCSDDLLQYLASSGNAKVEVSFELSYSMGFLMGYEIKKIGSWQGEFVDRPRSFFYCSGYGSCDPSYFGSQPGSPLNWK